MFAKKKTMLLLCAASMVMSDRPVEMVQQDYLLSNFEEIADSNLFQEIIELEDEEESSLLQKIYCYSQQCLSMDKKFKKLQAKIEIALYRLKQLKFDPKYSSVYLIGPTGNGKSTLINYMLKAKLIITKKEGISNNIHYLIDHEFSGRYPRIGNDGSETKFPDIYHDEEKMMAYVDTAGFGDTNGPEDQIVNAYSLSKIFQRGKKIKLIIVVDYSTIEENWGAKFISIIEQTSKMFGSDLQYLQNSAALAVTKVRWRQQTFIDKSCNFIKNLFYKKNNNYITMHQEKNYRILIQELQKVKNINSNSMSEQAKNFIKSLIDPDRFIIFPNPDFLTLPIVQNIKKKIENLPLRILTQDAKVSLQKQAQILLKNFRQEIDQYMKKLVDRIKKDIKLSIKGISKTPGTIKQSIQKLTQSKNFIEDMEQDVKKNLQITEKFSKNYHKAGISQNIAREITTMLRRYELCKILQPEINNPNYLLTIKQILDQSIQILNSECDKIMVRQQIQKIQQEILANQKIRKEAEEIVRKNRLKQQQEAKIRVIKELQGQNRELRQQLGRLKKKVHQIEEYYAKFIEESQKKNESRWTGFCPIM